MKALHSECRELAGCTMCPCGSANEVFLAVELVVVSASVVFCATKSPQYGAAVVFATIRAAGMISFL